MSEAVYHITEAEKFIGKEIAVSDWVTVTQPMVDMFAESTKDPDWMHVDVERSERESPYGGTIIQGFLMMSLLIHMSHQTNVVPDGTVYGLNYGLDRLRFTSVVPVGSRIRTHIKLADVKERGDGRYLVKTNHYVEVEGSDKPALVADWLALWFVRLEAA